MKVVFAAHTARFSSITPTHLHAWQAASADVVQIYTGHIYKGPALVGEATLAIKKSR